MPDVPTIAKGKNKSKSIINIQIAEKQQTIKHQKNPTHDYFIRNNKYIMGENNDKQNITTKS